MDATHLLHGAANRKVAATNMNRASSRSHSWESQGVTHHRFSRPNLVDLAGSERSGNIFINRNNLYHCWCSAALVDFSGMVDDEFLERLVLVKGTRKVVNHQERGRVLRAIYGCSYKAAAGGSLSNTLVALVVQQCLALL
ncbi:hypothetical protein Leryth_004000 [Lithospermum erythrorhizon]|nr:hypothetical protein Leryth_004000 [Lithospermum erythrorhizon]